MSAPRVAGLSQLLAEHGDAPYREVLRVPALSLGLFAAAPGHDDLQSPHEVDEVYVVVAGRAVLEVDGVRTPVETGTVAYVPPHVPHRFVDVVQDLRVACSSRRPNPADLGPGLPALATALEPRGRSGRPKRMRLQMIGLVAVGLVLAGCGDETVRVDPGVASEPPAASRSALTTGHPVTVLDDGDGAELCLAGVADSLPPQCSGPQLIGWDWADHDGYYEDRAGVRWGEFSVTGTFDGTDVTVTDAVPAEGWSRPGPATDVDFSSPCPEPPGGWPGGPMRTSSPDAVFSAAQALPDYAGGWVTQRDPRGAAELDQASADDPEAQVLPPIVNIKVSGDPTAAEAELRKVWDGPLCVITAERTEAELRTIQDEVVRSTDGMLSASIDVIDGTVQLRVVHDDGTLQTELDERYGEDVVEVESALVPAE